MKRSFYIFVFVVCTCMVSGCLPKRIPNKGVADGDASSQTLADGSVDLLGETVDDGLKDNEEVQEQKDSTLDQTKPVDVDGNNGDQEVGKHDADKIPPMTTVTKGPDAVTKDLNAIFEFTCSEVDCKFKCRLDFGLWEDCASPKGYTGLSEGDHTFEVQATDSANNEEQTPKEWKWQTDISPPVTTIQVQPKPETTSRESRFEFSCDQPPCSFQCQVDGGLWADCSSPQTFEDLSFSKHTIRIQAKDAAGNTEFVPRLVEWTMIGWDSVAVGGRHSCGLTISGTLFCWGRNAEGQLGNGESAPREDQPSPIKIGVNWSKVVGGEGHTCGFRTDKSLSCWGWNGEGQLGNGETLPGKDNSSPTPIFGGEKDWAQFTSTGYHVCALKANNTLWCWGMNQFGQIGNDDLAGTNVSKPTQIDASAIWVDLSSGRGHTCGIKLNEPTDGDQTLWCWGWNDMGQLGNGDTQGNNLFKPQQIGTDKDWKKVVAGWTHSCAIKKDKSLWCWGSNKYGQLGNQESGDGKNKFAPQKIGTGMDWVDISLGENFSCGLREDKSLWCWGNNKSGELANGLSGVGELLDKPTQVGAENLWSGVSAGEGHTCATKIDNSLWCWGWNGDGQVGVEPKNEENPLPIKVTIGE